MKLDRLKADYGRYLAIKERQKADWTHGVPEYLELMKEFTDALPGLLRVCDAYQELLTVGAWPERLAEKKLEELLG